MHGFQKQKCYRYESTSAVPKTFMYASWLTCVLVWFDLQRPAAGMIFGEDQLVEGGDVLGAEALAAARSAEDVAGAAPAEVGAVGNAPAGTAVSSEGLGVGGSAVTADTQVGSVTSFGKGKATHCCDEIVCCRLHSRSNCTGCIRLYIP
jgi:hypothetical protein